MVPWISAIKHSTKVSYSLSKLKRRNEFSQWTSSWFGPKFGVRGSECYFDFGLAQSDGPESLLVTAGSCDRSVWTLTRVIALSYIESDLNWESTQHFGLYTAGLVRIHGAFCWPSYDSVRHFGPVGSLRIDLDLPKWRVGP